MPNLLGQISREYLGAVVDSKHRQLIPNPEHGDQQMSEECRSAAMVAQQLSQIAYLPPMQLTAIIYPDPDTDWLVAECPETGTASHREATELYLESFPQTVKRTAAVRSFDLAHA